MNPKSQERVRRIVERGKFDPDQFRRRIDFSHRFLLFIPVETQRSRRVLVIGYYLFFLVVGVAVIWFRGPAKYDRLLPLAFYLGSALGGMTFTGPVRLFSRWQRKFKDGSAWGIDPNLPHPYLSGRTLISADHIDRLDEHDIAVRDRAHYLAYAALRYPAMLAAMFGLIFMIDATPAQVEHVLFLASVPVAVLFFSLPQAIILWTEPDLDPDPEDPGTQTVFTAN
jgi:hypothetical protein